MAAFLVIYSKSGTSPVASFEKVISDFGMNDARKLIQKKTDGILVCVVDTFAENLYENEQGISFVSGHISFETTGETTGSTTVQQFNHLVSKKGTACFDQLEGMFAAIHYNKQDRTLIYANDKFGIAPLFVYEDSGHVILSNEYHPLAQYNSELNTAAIAEFLTLGLTLGSKTFFRHIKNMEPASYVTVSSNHTEQNIYWEPTAGLENASDPDRLAKDMHSLFTSINREYIDANLTGFCLLTAGADSRLIVSTLSQKQLQETRFYTSNLSFLDPLEDKDVVGASAIASKFNLKHRIEKISFYENSFDEHYFDKERELRETQVYGGWHGGELLGGFCFHAAPINKPLHHQDVDKTYKSIFSWWFRFRQKTHPYKSYREELHNLKGNGFLFMIHQMTRSFFTNIYDGTRGHWVQPFQLANHGFSPFWDSRFLQLLLNVPVDALKEYSFYNQVLQLVGKEFTAIPSNSPLTNRADSVMPKMESGVEPKNQIPHTHHQSYKDYLNSPSIFNRGYYTKKLRKILENEFDPITKKWLDLEVWYGKYAGK